VRPPFETLLAKTKPTQNNPHISEEDPLKLHAYSAKWSRNHMTPINKNIRIQIITQTKSQICM
jgi:hypothetical protein